LISQFLFPHSYFQYHPKKPPGLEGVYQLVPSFQHNGISGMWGSTVCACQNTCAGSICPPLGQYRVYMPSLGAVRVYMPSLRAVQSVYALPWGSTECICPPLGQYRMCICPPLGQYRVCICPPLGQYRVYMPSLGAVQSVYALPWGSTECAWGSTVCICT